MLTPYTRSQFAEKILTDCHGRQFKAIFFVALVNGEVKARLVSLQPLAQEVLALKGEQSDGCLCLPTWVNKQVIETPYIQSHAPFASPYFDIETILNSQPTRAPSV